MANRELNVLARVAGSVLLIFGVGLVALAIWMAERQLTIRGHIEQGALIFIGIAGLISLFCLTVGYRLAANRPNEYQSVLPPWGWLLIALFFGASAAAFLVLGPTSQELTLGAILCGAFSFQAIRAATAAHSRKAQKSAL